MKSELEGELTPLAHGKRRQLVDLISGGCCCQQQDSDEWYCV